MRSEHHLACTRHGLFSVTSNIDGHWDRTEGVGPEKVYECHGAPWYMQMPRQLFFSGNLLELDMFFLMFVCSGCLFPRTKHISTTTCLLIFVTLLSGSDNLTCHVWGSYQNAMRGRWQKYMAHRSQRHCRHTSPCLGFGSWWKGAT